MEVVGVHLLVLAFIWLVAFQRIGDKAACVSSARQRSDERAEEQGASCGEFLFVSIVAQGIARTAPSML